MRHCAIKCLHQEIYPGTLILATNCPALITFSKFSTKWAEIIVKLCCFLAGKQKAD